jgi:signal transduction histidine kinase/DNA-binding NarL/FixJ family response regulator
MMDDDDLLHLVDDEPRAAASADAKTWTIAVIDDDPAVHEGTRFALYDYSLHGQGLRILSAYSAAEGRALLAQEPDIAVVLLDVVMETDSAGLDLVDYIRKELKNETVRVVLRTGQPGQAPERRVIIDYDINDYKAKTELTADKLFTTLTAALRSYQQLQRMVETRRGLEIIIEAASTLFDFQSMQRLAQGVLTQLASLLKVDCAGILVVRDDGLPEGRFSVLAGSGCYRTIVNDNGRHLDETTRGRLTQAFQRRCNEFVDHRSTLYICTGSGRELVVLLEADKELSATDRQLIELFSSRLSVAFDNVILYGQLQDANARLEERVFQRTSELYKANQRLAAQRADLRRANEFKAEMLGTVAHDLKNPLGVILGRTEILTDLLATDPPAYDAMRAQLGHIRDTSRRLSSMVDDLIVEAMNDAFDIAIRREIVDYAGLVGEVVAANRPLAERKGQQIHLSGLGALPICGDQERLREAIDNLVGNAIKYNPVGGEIEVSVTIEDREAVCTVSDRGPGLSPEDLGRLFGRFQRLSAKPTAGEGSTGLGLSIVKRIAELHGGRVTAESAGPGEGAAFALIVPLAHETEMA